MATYQILYWHDIPVQVKAKVKRKRHSVELPQRFQIAVDNAAMEADLVGSDGYLEAFVWTEAKSRDGDEKTVAEAVAAEIVADIPRVDWRATAEKIKAG